MILKDIKESMLYQACEYEPGKQDMQRFHDINEKAQISPETDILHFYLGAHILGELERKFGVEVELPPEAEALALKWHGQMEEVFIRIFTYVMLISIGESRHGNTTSNATQAQIKEKFGDEVAAFANAIKGKNRSGARHAFLQADRDLHLYAKYCDWAFIACFGGGSFGGAKWKNISNKITQVLEGEISPFTMADISWALVHNTGSIFNKNTIYQQEMSSGSLTHLLDAQRGGAIPALIMHHAKYIAHVSGLNVYDHHTGHFVDDVKEAAEVLGEEFYAYVEPQAIAEAGALAHVWAAASIAEQDEAGDKPEPKLELVADSINIGIADFPKMQRIKE